MQRVLITGISGFVGSCLRTALLPSAEVTGFDAANRFRDGSVFIGEITDGAALLDVLRRVQPDVIFHLAGILKSAQSADFYSVHALGTAALLDAVIESGLRPRVVVASSSAVYGAGVGAKPISESFKPRPLTHYAASKIAQETIALRYFEAFNLPVICARTFNLLGPGLSPGMAPSAFAKQIAQAEKIGKPAQIAVGDLSARRDYVDVRDAVRAYALLSESGKAGQVYNVCSGQATPTAEILQILLDQAKVPIEAVLDSARVQKQDVPVQIGSAKKIRQLTGWKPEIGIKQSLTDLLNDWREKINLENIE